MGISAGHIQQACACDGKFNGMRCVSRLVFFFSSRRRHTRFDCDWSSDVCSSDLVEEQALIDGLSGLANRRHAEASLETELQRAGRFGGPLAFVLCDLDSFKNVNEDRKSVV